MAEEIQAVEAPAPTQPIEEVGLDELHVKVWSPFKIFFDGKATSVSAVNGTGPFDVLPRHHNFITIVTTCDLGLVTADGELKIRISGGVMHVRKNNVTVFLEV